MSDELKQMSLPWDEPAVEDTIEDTIGGSIIAHVKAVESAESEPEPALVSGQVSEPVAAVEIATSTLSSATIEQVREACENRTGLVDLNEETPADAMLSAMATMQEMPIDSATADDEYGFDTYPIAGDQRSEEEHSLVMAEDSAEFGTVAVLDEEPAQAGEVLISDGIASFTAVDFTAAEAETAEFPNPLSAEEETVVQFAEHTEPVPAEADLERPKLKLVAKPTAPTVADPEISAEDSSAIELSDQPLGDPAEPTQVEFSTFGEAPESAPVEVVATEPIAEAPDSFEPAAVIEPPPEQPIFAVDDVPAPETLLPIEDKKSVGRTFLEARERLQLSISEVAEATRIRSDYIVALEQDAIACTPLAPVYVKSYIKSLCRHYDLRVDTLVDEYARTVPREQLAIRNVARADSSGPAPEPEEHMSIALKWSMTALLVLITVCTVAFFVVDRDIPPVHTEVTQAQPLQEDDLNRFIAPSELPLTELPVPGE